MENVKEMMIVMIRIGHALDGTVLTDAKRKNVKPMKDARKVNASLSIKSDLFPNHKLQ